MNKNQVRDRRESPIFVTRAFMNNAADLGPTAIAVYTALCHFAVLGDDCDPSIPEIAKLIGCSQNPVRSALQKLVKERWIEIERRKLGPNQNDTNLYTLLPDPVTGGVLQNLNQGTSESEGKSTTPNDNSELSKTIIEVWEESNRQIVPPLLADSLFESVDRYGEELCFAAVIEGVKSLGVGRLNYKYYRAICERHDAAGTMPGDTNGKPAHDLIDPLDLYKGLGDDEWD